MKIIKSLKEKNQDKPVRHIIALSGGKDSSALAVYMRGKIPNVEYVFCDTGEELQETYDYIHKLQDYLNIEVKWLKDERDFQYYLDLYNGVLPDSNTRWCTRMLKIKPYEKYIGDDSVISYVGIRADEPHRTGYISTKSNIKTVFPFMQDGINRDAVIRILEDAGLGLPEYYQWRSRSGCYFCFFQQKREWVGLLERHPDFFKKAKQYEKINPKIEKRYTWMENESLEELERPERIAEIKEDYEKRENRIKNSFKGNQKLMDIWIDDDMEDDSKLACDICSI